MSWVSFLDGLQRVVLVTGDALLAAGAHTLGEAEPLRTELVLAMHGLGLSLVNDTEALEIVYVSISKLVQHTARKTPLTQRYANL